MKRLAIAGAVALAVMAPGTESQAQMTMKFAQPAPPRSLVNQWGVIPWAKKVEKESGGELKIQIFSGPVLGTFNNIYDRTAKGVTDFSFGILGPMGARFAKSSVMGLPFETENAWEAAMGQWGLYERGLISEEYKDTHPLVLFSFPHSRIHTNKPIKTLEDIQGMKLASSNRLQASIATMLGVTPVTMTPAEMYQGVSRHLVEGVFLAWTAIYPFKIAEVTNFHFEAPLSGSPAYFTMNKRSYAKLSGKAKAAIDANSGRELTDFMGRVIDRMDDDGRQRVAKLKGHTIAKIDPAEAARFKKRLEKFTQAWIKRTPNGAAILAAFREEVAKLRSMKK